MHFRLLSLFLAALLPALAADRFTGRVVAVHDGDTITVEAPDHTVKVRLFGIDCPETKQDAQAHKECSVGYALRAQIKNQLRQN